MSRRLISSLVAFAALAMLASVIAAQTLNGFDLKDSLVPPDQLLHGGPGRDGIPAIDAPKFKGEKLTPVALTHTTWADWRTRHPDTLVLSVDTGFNRDYSRDPYAGYASSARIMFPTINTSNRFPPKEPVLGVELNGARKAYAFSELAKALGNHPRGTIDDRLGGSALSIRFDRENRTAQAFDSSGRELPAYVAFRFAWSAFYPTAEIFVAREGAQ